MIKKNTKLVFIDKDNDNEELVGGIPLSVNEIVKVNKNGNVIEYIVSDKNIELLYEGEDQVANIIYTLKRK